MKLELSQDLAHGRLTIAMVENCHGDSVPLLNAIWFNRFQHKIAPDTATLAAAMVASRWSGECMEFAKLRISPDVAEAIHLMVPDAKFVQPVDGYRRHLCQGHLDVVVASAAQVLQLERPVRPDVDFVRLVTWSGEYVDRTARNSTGYVAGEVSTNANMLLPDWEISVCLGLLVGGLELRSVSVPLPPTESAQAFATVAQALRILGIQLSPLGPTGGDRSAATTQSRASLHASPNSSRSFSPAVAVECAAE